MRYVGGKFLISNWISEYILQVKGSRPYYLEPFLGSGATFSKMAPMFQKSWASDSHPDLILMWRAICDGWIPPISISREEYQRLKDADSSAWRGLVGFGSSFGGKWFGGYVDQAFDKRGGIMTKPFLETAVKSLDKVSKSIGLAEEIVCCDYSDWIGSSATLIYADPPYRGTLGYGEIFDSDRFWICADRWVSEGSCVVVSESSPPPRQNGWKVIASRERGAALRVAKDGKNPVRTEMLFAKGIS